jgi:hypothetical protein
LYEITGISEITAAGILLKSLKDSTEDSMQTSPEVSASCAEPLQRVQQLADQNAVSGGDGPETLQEPQEVQRDMLLYEPQTSMPVKDSTGASMQTSSEVPAPCAELIPEVQLVDPNVASIGEGPEALQEPAEVQIRMLPHKLQTDMSSRGKESVESLALSDRSDEGVNAVVSSMVMEKATAACLSNGRQTESMASVASRESAGIGRLAQDVLSADIKESQTVSMESMSVSLVLAMWL